MTCEHMSHTMLSANSCLRTLCALVFLAFSSAATATGPSWLNAAAAEPMLVLGSRLASAHDVRAALYTESRLQRTLPGILFDAGFNASAADSAADIDGQPRVVDIYDTARDTRS